MYKYKRREKMEEMSSQEKNKEKMSPQAKYRELTSSIQVLSIRAIAEDNQEVYEKLRRIAKYLEEVRAQRHLCMLSEKDRTEKVRYNELLEYIDKQYDGTEVTLKEICRELDKREDVDEVLKYHDEKNKKSKEAER